jgi:DNA polymerase (family 10)
MHNVALRQRAIKRGLTLSEYALLRLEDNVIVAAASEEEIYNAPRPRLHPARAARELRRD